METALTTLADSARARAVEVEDELSTANEWDGELDALPQELFVELLVARGKYRLHTGRAVLRYIPAWVATVGALGAAYLLRQATGAAHGLEKWLVDALPEEAEDRLHGLIDARMNGLAVALELDVIQRASPKQSALAVAIDTFEQALDTFDRALFAQRGRLARLPDSVFHNYRETVSFAHLDPMPWWLDGRLG